MNDNYSKLFRVNDSGLGCFLTLLMVALLLGSVGLQWIVNSILVLIAFLIITPVIAWFGFRWWLKRNLVEDNCPVCSYESTALKNSNFQCPNCGEPLKIEAGHFIRLTPPGTIDIDAVEVQVQQLDE